MRHICVLFSLALASCATGEFAAGPIKMSDATLKSYIYYKNLPSPEYFAVAVNGSGSGWTYCPDGGNCAGNRIGAALDACTAYAKGTKCVIYAYRGKPVFDGEDLPTLKATSPTPPLAGPAPAASAPAPAPTPPTITEPRPVSRPTADRLRELQALRDQNLTTQQEHDERRRAILGSL